ncbi:MAG TPA: 30S ribosomal protein S17 [Candidatus Nanoarchaeia archaeon]|nr:30S ribosomal protein S17 [Candidatus Nanoarchaeia archaeon]
MNSKARDIGLGIKAPFKECDDKNCAFHGSLSVRGRTFLGKVTKINLQRTAVVEWSRLFYLPKYQRYEKRKSKLHVHSPACMEIKTGDAVRIVECRPISKTKNFVVVEKLQ